MFKKGNDIQVGIRKCLKRVLASIILKYWGLIITKRNNSSSDK